MSRTGPRSTALVPVVAMLLLTSSLPLFLGHTLGVSGTTGTDPSVGPTTRASSALPPHAGYGPTQAQSAGVPSFRLWTDSRASASCPLGEGNQRAWLGYDEADASFWVAAPPACVDVFAPSGSGFGYNQTGSVLVGTDPFGVAVDNATNDIFVTNSGSNNVSVINASTLALITTISVGTSPYGIAYDWASNDIYVANGGSSNVSVISGSSLAVIGTVSVGATPVGVAADPATGQVFVANHGSNNATVISDATNSVAATVATGNGSYGVALDNSSGELFVSNEGSSNLSVIDATTDLVSSTVPVLSLAVDLQGIAYDWRTGLVWVGAGAAFAVVVNATTNLVIGYSNTDPSGVAYDPDNGDVCVTNTANWTFQCLSFHFYLPAQTIIFHETGLPGGFAWEVTVSETPANRTTQYTTADNISMGAWPWTSSPQNYFEVPPAEGYVARPSSGVVNTTPPPNVSSPVVVNVSFAPPIGSYNVTFVETGLPTGTSWSVDLNGTINRSTSNTNTVWEPNGTYAYTVEPVAGYFASYLGVVQVYGAPVTVNVTILPTFAVWFNETGLPLGTNGSVTLNNSLAPYQTLASTGPSIRFQLPNGSGDYGIAPIPGYTTDPWTGGYHVQGRSLTISVAWSEVTYSVVFNETGLPVVSANPVGPFTVTLNGTEEEGSSDASAVFSEPNGSYPFVVTPPGGWTVSPQAGTVLVHGQAVVQTLNFSVVIPPLKVSFTYQVQTGCGGPFNVTFTSTVTGGTPPYTYSWNLGDGSPGSSQADPTHEYSGASTSLTVTLTVHDSGGLTASSSVELQVIYPACAIHEPTSASPSYVVLALAILAVAVLVASVAVLVVFVYRKRQP